MYTAQDYNEGKGRAVKVKAHTSVLPYLKSKEVKVTHNPAVTEAGKEDPKGSITSAVNQYDEARREIMREHAGEE